MSAPIVPPFEMVALRVPHWKVVSGTPSPVAGSPMVNSVVLNWQRPSTGAGQFGPVDEIERLGVHIFEVDRDVGAVVEEVLAGGQRHEADAAVALLGYAALAAETDAVEVAAEDEVDDAGDGVGAVDRRAAARDHVDALDEVAREWC